VAADPARERELLEQAPDPVLVESLVRIDLSTRLTTIPVRVTSPFSTFTSTRSASMPLRAIRSQTSSRMRSSERL
jgi:hypothetical protein